MRSRILTPLESEGLNGSVSPDGERAPRSYLGAIVGRSYAALGERWRASFDSRGVGDLRLEISDLQGIQ